MDSLPFSKTLWKTFYFTSASKLVFKIRNLFLHYLFGYILDLCAPLTGTKLRLVPIYRKFDKISAVLEPFSLNEFTFSNANVTSLWTALSPGDQARFPFNIGDLNWDDYLVSYVEGILVHQMRDKLDPDTRKHALRRYKRLCLAHQCVKTVLYFSLLCFFVWLFRRVLF
ncbi:hypothetical protein WDU94_012780 [Cyamophila willieti]